MRKQIKIFEHQKLLLSNKSFQKKHLDLLAKFATSNDNKFYSLIYNGVKFKSYVGVIQVGDLTIEVLPKADREEVDHLQGKKKDEYLAKWQKVLIDMLRQSGYLELESLSESNLKLRSNSILDLYLEMFLNEVSLLLKRGLIKKYIQKEGNRNALKGSLQFSKHISKNVIHKEKFYVRYQEYDKDHLINRILYKTLCVIPQLSPSPLLTDTCARLKMEFPEVPDVKVQAALFDKIKLGRKALPYQKALEISRLILLNLHPDFSTGQNHVLALMFDMNLLFEKYVYRKLKQASRENDFEVTAQTSRKFWETKTIRPDIYIKKGGYNYVLDTKWKILSDPTPSDADLKQMYVYNHYYESHHSILLYPDVFGLQGRQGTYALHKKEGGAHHCKIGFAKVLDGEVLNKGIAEEVIGLLGNVMQNYPL